MKNRLIEEFLSTDYLIEHYAAMADYKKAAEYISVSADLGYVFNHGYFELIHAIKLSEVYGPIQKNYYNM